MPVTETEKKKGCGTCRDRKIRCDKAVPICGCCIRARRVCSGYGLRLSWPKENDKRRAIVAETPHLRSKNFNMLDNRIINAGRWEMELCNYASIQAPITNCNLNPTRVPWTSIEDMDTDMLHLLDEFTSKSFKRLRTIDGKPLSIRNVLLRMATEEQSPSSVAVLKSMLALASLDRYGVQQQAIEMKLSAIQALVDSAQNLHGEKEIMRHIAAGMLLLNCETREITNTTNCWTWYIAGIKDLVKELPLNNRMLDPDHVALLQWVVYHDLCARFSLWHWQGNDTRMTVQPISGSYVDEACPSVRPLFTVLYLLLKACEVVRHFSLSTTLPVDGNQSLEVVKDLETRVKNIYSLHRKIGNSENDRVRFLSLATLIYLRRATGTPSDDLHIYMSEGIEIIENMDQCDNLLPLFLIGSEARNDSDRLAVLDLVARTPKSVLCDGTMGMIQCLWTQHDLAEDSSPDYLRMLIAVISQCTIMTVFL